MLTILLVALRLQIAHGSLEGYALISGEVPLRCGTVAAVSVEPQSVHFSLTDSDGHFLFTVLPPGAYQILILEPACTHPPVSVSVTRGRRSRVDVHLVRASWIDAGLHDVANRADFSLVRLRAGRTYRELITYSPR